MGLVALSVATLCYFVTACDLFLKREWSMAVVFGAYGIANLGLIAAAYAPAVTAAIGRALR